MSPRSSAPVIEAAGALCAVGRGIGQVYASVRAGIGAARVTAVRDRHGETMTMALVPAPAIEPLKEPLVARGLTGRLARIVQLAAPALREAAAVTGGAAASAPLSLPLFLGLPEPRTGASAYPAAELAAMLAEQSGVALDVQSSQVFTRGRTAALRALEAAARAVDEGRVASVLVGGADTFLDLGLLAQLDDEGRILGPRVADGFVPGEGAAFLRLGPARSSRAAGASPAVAVLGVATAEDPGHRYSTQPARGEGLSAALAKLLAAPAAPHGPIGSVFAGFNGESFDAKEWGVASLRHGARFAPGAHLHHPADCFGDTGAAAGALLLALAWAALGRGHRAGPALIFASADREDRACALLDVAG